MALIFLIDIKKKGFSLRKSPDVYGVLNSALPVNQIHIIQQVLLLMLFEVWKNLLFMFICIVTQRYYLFLLISKLFS
jgi:hypothetical protein